MENNFKAQAKILADSVKAMTDTLEPMMDQLRGTITQEIENMPPEEAIKHGATINNIMAEAERESDNLKQQRQRYNDITSRI